MRRLLPLLLCAGCGPVPGPVLDGFTTALEEARGWRAVLPQSYLSKGHAGQRVRVTFNPAAEPTYTGTTEPVVFAEGAVIAKHVLADDGTALSDASKVYFMRKEAPGYDPSGNDWSWAVAQRTAEGLRITQSGKDPGCTGCHRAEARWDYARSVEVFRTQQAP